MTTANETASTAFFTFGTILPIKFFAPCTIYKMTYLKAQKKNPGNNEGDVLSFFQMHTDGMNFNVDHL